MLVELPSDKSWLEASPWYYVLFAALWFYAACPTLPLFTVKWAMRTLIKRRVGS